MKIKVCASSANLGPGFDCFGLAWQLYNTMEFLPGTDGLTIEGCPEKYRNENNLAYKAYKAAIDAVGAQEIPLTIRFLDSQIPVSRGLGSSAALIVGGVTAANALHSLKLSKQELFSIATAVEGHPDNIAPALFGGLTVSTMDGGSAVTVPFELSAKLHFTALIPDFELSTEVSRGVLPQTVTRQDAIFNISRAALLLKALGSGDAELITLALQDKIHQPYRTKLIAGYDTALEAAMELGAAGVCISGAGSTVLCISESEFFAHRMAHIMAEELTLWRVLPLLPDVKGAQISQF